MTIMLHEIQPGSEKIIEAFQAAVKNDYNYSCEDWDYDITSCKNNLLKFTYRDYMHEIAAKGHFTINEGIVYDIRFIDGEPIT